MVRFIHVKIVPIVLDIIALLMKDFNHSSNGIRDEKFILIVDCVTIWYELLSFINIFYAIAIRNHFFVQWYFLLKQPHFSPFMATCVCAHLWVHRHLKIEWEILHPMDGMEWRSFFSLRKSIVLDSIQLSAGASCNAMDRVGIRPIRF